MKPVKIPQRVDDPPHLGIFSADEFFPVVIGLVGGMQVGQAFWFSIAGLTMTFAYRRYREAHPDGFVVHMMYWSGTINLMSSRTFINPLIKRFLP